MSQTASARVFFPAYFSFGNETLLENNILPCCLRLPDNQTYSHPDEVATWVDDIHPWLSVQTPDVLYYPIQSKSL